MRMEKCLVGMVFIAVGAILFPSTMMGQFQSPIILQPTNPDGSFGFGLASGDVTGDGIADVVAGSVLTSVGGRNAAGVVHVFFGGASPHTSPDLTLQAPSPEGGARFGWSIAIGDVNGDGQKDIVVGALFANGGTDNGTGAVYVFFGGSLLDAQADATLQVSGLNPLAHFGWSLAAGDVTGDGIDDVVVGAENVRVGGRRQAGEVFLFAGSRSFSGTLTASFLSPAPQEGGAFGHSVAVGNLNGDPFADIIVGAPNEDAGSTEDAGRTYVFLGGATVDPTVDAALSQPIPLPSSGFGAAVTSGDVNGDGFDDVIVGTPHPRLTRTLFSAQSDPGEVYIFLGGNPFDSTSDRRLQAPAPARNDAFGGSLAAGDVNRDGSDDLIVGSVAIVGGGVDGKAYLFFGGAASDASADFTFVASPPERNAQFSVAVAAGDINGDGRADAVIGSVKPGTLGLGQGQGKVFAFLAQ